MTQNLAARLALVGLVLNAAFVVPMYFAAPSTAHFLALFSAWPALVQIGACFVPALVALAFSRSPVGAGVPS
jgi:hypothetical protein